MDLNTSWLCTNGRCVIELYSFNLYFYLRRQEWMFTVPSALLRDSVAQFLFIYFSTLAAWALFAVLKIFGASRPVSHCISPPTSKKRFPKAVCTSENIKTEAPVFSLTTDENKMLVIRICVVLLNLGIFCRWFKKEKNYQKIVHYQWVISWTPKCKRSKNTLQLLTILCLQNHARLQMFPLPQNSLKTAREFGPDVL